MKCVKYNLLADAFRPGIDEAPEWYTRELNQVWGMTEVYDENGNLTGFGHCAMRDESWRAGHLTPDMIGCKKVYPIGSWAIMNPNGQISVMTEEEFNKNFYKIIDGEAQ